MVLTTETHLRQYREEGYCLVEDLIPGDLVEAARQRTMEIAEALPDWPAKHFQVLDPGRYTSEGGGPLPGGIVEESAISGFFKGHFIAFTEGDFEGFTLYGIGPGSAQGYRGLRRTGK